MLIPVRFLHHQAGPGTLRYAISDTMANREFVFFYAPTWEYPPEGPIKLGNIITSVKKPHLPISCTPPQEEDGVFRTQKRSVKYTKDKMRSGKFSILTKFLSILGFGIDVGAEVTKG